MTDITPARHRIPRVDELRIELYFEFAETVKDLMQTYQDNKELPPLWLVTIVNDVLATRKYYDRGVNRG